MNPTALELFADLSEVEYLSTSARHPSVHGGHRQGERADLLRRAAVLQRLRTWSDARHVDSAQRQEVRELADESAERLRDYDAVHHTGRGPAPALDERWRGSAGAAAYVRQEVAETLVSLRQSLRARR